MKIIKSADREYDDIILKLVNRFSIENDRVEKEVRTILNDVRLSGDDGIQKYSMKFDNVDIFHDGLRVSGKKLKEAYDAIDPEARESLEFAALRIRKYHERQKADSWRYNEEDGIVLGQMVRPLDRIGIYVPGGKAVYPSSVLMNAVPAFVAGVKSVVMCTPARDGFIDPHILAAAHIVGIDEIYKIGGAQAIAAMAYGTRSIQKVDKIVGPGNIYVAIAKRLVYGVVDIDMIAGPSEILVIADDTAIPALVAADLLSQAEHDEDAFSICIALSPEKAKEIDNEVTRQLALISRSNIATASLRKNGVLIVEEDIDKAIDIANVIAPEHLELMIADPFSRLEQVRNAGAVFLGRYTPEAIGDFIAGPNHVLPTAGTAKFKSPLSVDDFIKKTSIISFSKEGIEKYGAHAARIAKIEKLEAHSNSVTIRMEKGL